MSVRDACMKPYFPTSFKRVEKLFLQFDQDLVGVGGLNLRFQIPF